MADTTSGATSLANRLRVSAIAREDRVQSAFSDGNDNTMWQSAWSMVASINNRVASSPSPIDPVLLDIDLHDLWHIYWHGAINTDDNSAKLDLLALQIIQLRDQGVLRYQTPGGAVEVTASNGRRLWTDLPFLVEDMMEHWTNNCAALSSDQRLSGAQFLANIAAAGAAADDALCGIALVVLRETLERPRPRSLLAPTDGDDKRGMGDLTIADLLPAANAWLFTAGYKLVMLSDSQWEGCSAEVGGFGELLTPGRSTWELPRHVGFSPQRWIWWLRRLDELASIVEVEEEDSEAEEQGEEGVAQSLLWEMMDNMIHIAAQTNGPVGEATKQAGELVAHRPRVRLLGPG